jgi:hypothetical protein
LAKWWLRQIKKITTFENSLNDAKKKQFLEIFKPRKYRSAVDITKLNPQPSKKKQNAASLYHYHNLVLGFSNALFTVSIARRTAGPGHLPPKATFKRGRGCRHPDFWGPAEGRH